MKLLFGMDKKMLKSLTQLVEQSYPVTLSNLESIHLFESNERGVYKVERLDGPPLLLRATRAGATAMDRFIGIARALDVLAVVGYPAPSVQCTNANDLLAANDDWIVLLLTFIEGEPISDSLADMTAMGEMLAQLHLLEPDELRKIQPAIPDCRYYPKEKLKPWLENLRAVAELIPPELESRYQFCVKAVTSLLAWPELPVSILHSDCNPQNAIRATNGQITFIDWDGIGFGPAVLDLAYLLFYCHICQKSWPTIEPNKVWIGAVLRGYEQHRALSSLEVEYLPDAIALVECHHLARGLPTAVQGDWTQDRGLTRFYGREQIVTQITEIALAYYGNIAY